MSAAERRKGATIARIPLAALLIGCALAGALPEAAAAPPSEQQCRTAVVQALDMLRGEPLATARDEQRRKQLLGEMEQLVGQHRGQGVGACTTWAEILRRAAHQ
ncbi:MAG: hypothetical protein ACYC7J_14780 [Syntrophales bacterium]